MLRNHRIIAAILAVFVLVFTVSVSAETAVGTAGAASQAAVSQGGTAQGGEAETGSKSSYMCFVGLSGALSTSSGVRAFVAECFKPSVAEAIRKAQESTEVQTLPEQSGDQNSDTQAVWPDPSKPMVALTFDDGPYSPVTDRILAKLEEYGGHATFFVVGNRVSTYSASVQRAVKDGCEIGNHTYEHKNLTKLTGVQIQKQLHDTDLAVAYYAGAATSLLRPVGGALNDTVRSSAGKPLINWSIDTLDWKNRNAASVKSRALNNVKDGDIILMHDLYKTTADACDTLIPELVNRGFQLVTVSEMAAAKGRTLQNGTLYTKIL